MEKMLVNVDDKIRENITPRGDGNNIELTLF